MKPGDKILVEMIYEGTEGWPYDNQVPVRDPDTDEIQFVYPDRIHDLLELADKVLESRKNTPQMTSVKEWAQRLVEDVWRAND